MTLLHRDRGFKGVPLEGFHARWYARTTEKNISDYRNLAASLASQLTGSSSVLEVAPGPGYLAIELAKRGAYGITGLDISQSFVQMAALNAKRAGANIDFRQGDAASMPFEPESFDLIVCRAAFKNFTRPVEAIKEMHRVLRVGGSAIIYDLRPDAPANELDRYVITMGLGPVNSLITKLIFRHVLVKGAYTAEQFRVMASQTPFKTCDISGEQIGLQITLTKHSG